MRRLAVVAALALVTGLGCPTAAPQRTTALIDSVVADRNGGRGRLLRELAQEVRASYLHELDGAAAGAVIDPRVGMVAIGAGPADLAIGVAPPARWPLTEVNAEPTRVVSRALETHLSADDTVGWSFDEATLELPVCGRTASAPIRVFQVYVRESDRWTLIAEHVGYPQPMGRWLDAAAGPERLRLAPDAVRLPDAIERQPEAAAARAALVEAIAPAGDRVATWDGGAEALAVWPDPLQVARGGAVRIGPSLADAIAADSVALDGLRLTLAPSRTVAIATAALTARVELAPSPAIDVRLRATFVLERGAGSRGTWRVHAAMVSVPITDEALVERTLGAAAAPPRDGAVAVTCPR